MEVCFVCISARMPVDEHPEVYLCVVNTGGHSRANSAREGEGEGHSGSSDYDAFVSDWWDPSAMAAVCCA